MKRSLIPADKVHYFVFAGGGAKGLVHLGAVQALEKVLQQRRLADSSTIKGFGGASAGALIAMALVMGNTSGEIVTMLGRQFGISEKGVPNVVADADDGIDAIIKRRSVVNGVYHLGMPELFGITNRDLILKEIDKDLYLKESFYNDPQIADSLQKAELVYDCKPAWGILGGFAGNVLGRLAADSPTEEVAKQIRASIKKRVKDTDWAFIARSREETNRYVFNFLFQDGLLPGAKLRAAILRVARQSPAMRKQTLEGVERLTFRRLHELTNLELAVTGTNSTRKASAFFSKRFTPEFPVIDAVAISMTYPFLFKPVWVGFEKKEKRESTNPANYRGNWVDGGVLNNLPIHAFDVAPDRALNYRVVGFTIRQPPDFRSEVTAHGMVFGNFGRFIETLLAQASQGQLRTEVEELQVLELNAKGLSTLDLVFNAHRAANAKLIKKARTDTEGFFGAPLECNDLVKSWADKDPVPPIDPITFQELARNQMRGQFKHVSDRELTIRPKKKDGSEDASAASFRVDILATMDDAGKGEFIMYEAKNSLKARISPRQANGIEKVAKYGGVIRRGDEDAVFPDGANISPQAVRVLRPSNLCAEFHLAHGYRFGHKPADWPKQSASERGDNYPDMD